MNGLKLCEHELPKCLKDIPKLLKGTPAYAADMFLAARPCQEGVWACEMALLLLNDATVRAQKKIPQENRDRFLKIMTDIITRSVAYGEDYLALRKLNFCWQILFAGMSEGKRRDEYLNNARFAIKQALIIIRRTIRVEEAEDAA